jgi:mRNA-degrading endonuclease RelE of RelBE toxin-antitoxin system
MPERTQLNININPDLLKKLKKVALENNRKLVEWINEILANYVNGIKNDQLKNRSILDELDEVKNRISVLENIKKIN